jgi:hypothetical protein
MTLFAAAVPTCAQTYEIDPPGSVSTKPVGINAGGAVTGWYGDSSGVLHGFVRDPRGNIAVFDPPSSRRTVPYGINVSGAVTGYYEDSTPRYRGFIRDPQGDIAVFDTTPGSVFTAPYSINASGAVTGHYDESSRVDHGFVRDPQGNIALFDPPGSISTWPLSISAGGAVTGYYEDSTTRRYRGFVRDAHGNIAVFNLPGSISTWPLSSNDSGAMTGVYEDSSGVGHGFVRDPLGKFAVFDPPGSVRTRSGSINTSGAVTGWYWDSSGILHGFVRDPQGNITVFDPSGSVLTNPYSINASGAVTGWYQDSSDADYHYSGFVSTVPNGMDISQYTTPGAIAGNNCACTPTTIPNSVWQSAATAGVSNVMVQAWGGTCPNKCAQSQLTSAQTYGFRTGAYVLLSYFNNQSAQYQVHQAVQAIGSAISDLKIIALDVEPCCGEFVNWKASTPYAVGAQIMDPANHIQTVTVAGLSGVTPPAWKDTGGTTSDGTVHWIDTRTVVASQAERITYISDAVSYIQFLYPHLKLLIHTSNGTDQNWTTITGNCGTTGTNLCPDLIAVPLWDFEHKTFTAGDGTQHLGDGVAGLVPWKPWGSTTWQVRNGNQYDWGSCANTGKCGNDSYFGLTAVDLDYFDPSLFR